MTAIKYNVWTYPANTPPRRKKTDMPTATMDYKVKDIKLADWGRKEITIAEISAAVGVHPLHLTIASLILNLAAGWLIASGDFLAGGLVLIPAGLADVFDGSIARLRGEESARGAFLDSVLDRVSDLIVFGSLYWALAGQGQDLEAALALVTLVVSLGVSFVRAEAEANGLAMTEGLFQRTERYVVTVLGLVIPGLLLPALALLAALGAFTLLQRVWITARRLAKGDSGSVASSDRKGGGSRGR